MTFRTDSNHSHLVAYLSQVICLFKYKPGLQVHLAMHGPLSAGQRVAIISGHFGTHRKQLESAWLSGQFTAGCKRYLVVNFR